MFESTDRPLKRQRLRDGRDDPTKQNKNAHLHLGKPTDVCTERHVAGSPARSAAIWRDSSWNPSSSTAARFAPPSTSEHAPPSTRVSFPSTVVCTIPCFDAIGGMFLPTA